MSISPTSRSLSQVPAGRPPAASQAGFNVPAEAAVDVAPGSSSPSVVRAGAVDVSLMLALQEHATAETGDREARQHGKQMLDALAELQCALLSGHGAGALDRLSEMSEKVPAATDPALIRVLRAIRLRARVEVARIEAMHPRRPAGA